jgi:DNA-binding beta-propeller fold protein YncE
MVACCGKEPSGIATDAIGGTGNLLKGHIWTADYQSSTVGEIDLRDDGTTSVASTGYAGGGLSHPNGIAVDGAGNVWLANYGGDTLTELEGSNGADPGHALSSDGGFGTDAHLEHPYGIAIDASGNVWVSNFGLSTITQFLGAATPAKTPLNGPAQAP